MNDFETRKKEVAQVTFTIKKLKTLPDGEIALSLDAVPAKTLKVDFGLAARTALQKVPQELATSEVELENAELREKLDALEMTVKAEDHEKPKNEI